jgi:hypothetical protein
MSSRFLGYTALFVIGIVVGILGVLVVFTNIAQFARTELRLYGENLLVRQDNNRKPTNEGSFEIAGNFIDAPDEPIRNGCKKLCGGSTALTPWQISRQGAPASQSCANASDAVAWCRADNSFNLTPTDGSFFVDLTGVDIRASSQFGSIQQNIEDTTPGASYELAFDVTSSSNFNPPSKPNLTPFYQLDVKIEGDPNGPLTSSIQLGPTTEVNHRVPQTIPFTAHNGGTTIVFSASGSNDGAGHGGAFLGIDNVSVRRTNCSVGQLILGCR